MLTGAGLTPTEALGCAFVLDGYARQIGGMRRDLRYSTATPVQSDTMTRSSHREPRRDRSKSAPGPESSVRAAVRPTIVVSNAEAVPFTVSPLP